MKNKIVKEIDEQNRLNLPDDLLRLARLKSEREVAICREKEYIKLRHYTDIKDCEVISITTMDEKGRIIIPSDIREETRKFKVSVINGEFCIKEAQ